MTNQIILDIEKYQARGSGKLVFQHPVYNDKLIKILAPNRLEEWDKERKNRLVKRRFGSYVVFQREIDEYLSVSMRTKNVPDYMQSFHGMCNTNLGIGEIVGKIPGKDSTLAPTLADAIRDELLSRSQSYELVNQILEKLLRDRVVVWDLNLNNFVLSDDGKEKKLVLIDGFGERNFIPIKKYFVWPMERAIEKRRLKIYNLIEKAFENTVK